VDNIHHDVFLSPKFVQAAREYLFDVIRQSTSNTYLPGIELRASRGPDGAGFRKLLSELLQSSLTQAKYHKNIEIDLLFRMGLLKFLSFEMGNQFANLILEGKEWIRKRGEHFERSQQAHVIKARLSELQSARKGVIRRVGQQVAQIVSDVEDNVIAKARRALFGEDFVSFYELCKNRLIFLDGGKDDVFFLEHYVLLGNYSRDPDRLRRPWTRFSRNSSRGRRYAQQDIMLQKENVVFPAVEENQPVLAKLVKRDKNLRQTGARRAFAMTLSSTSLTICATCCPTRRMTPFRADCSSDNRALMDVRLLAPLEMLAPLRIHSLPSRIRLAN